MVVFEKYCLVSSTGRNAGVGIGDSFNAFMWTTGQTIVRFFDIVINLVTARSKNDGNLLMEENAKGSALYL